MAFYPTWQADPSQGWQNQFIQQIPQNTPAITTLNPIEFQPQVRYISLCGNFRHDIEAKIDFSDIFQ